MYFLVRELQLYLFLAMCLTLLLYWFIKGILCSSECFSVDPDRSLLFIHIFPWNQYFSYPKRDCWVHIRWPPSPPLGAYINKKHLCTMVFYDNLLQLLSIAVFLGYLSPAKYLVSWHKHWTWPIVTLMLVLFGLSIQLSLSTLVNQRFSNKVTLYSHVTWRT